MLAILRQRKTRLKPLWPSSVSTCDGGVEKHRFGLLALLILAVL
jgi:hypothetical protein